MCSRQFTVIFHLLVTMLLINCAASVAPESRKSQADNDAASMATEMTNQFVATTSRIEATTSAFDRYGDDDDSEEDEDDDAMAMQQRRVQSRQLSDGVNPMLQIFNTVSNLLLKSAANAAQRSGSQLIGSKHNEEFKGDSGADDDNDNVTGSSQDGSNSTERAVEEGRYIKGDPLNGYYDFVITEGSYKFWVVFQLATAGLLIYSTLAAIYYSKVNPLTSDYDYVDYLSRSFHGRSMSEDSADVEDEGAIESGRTYLSSLANNKWVQAAAYGFQFAMDAIDKVPQ